MISALITSAALTVAVQSEPGCEDSARDVAFAFSRGDDAAATEFLDREACQGNAAFDAMRAVAAWRQGNFGEAAALAEGVVISRARDGCARTREVARLAFIAGASYLAEDDEALSRYHFWVAHRVSDAGGGLTRNERDVAERFSEDIGTYRSDHRRMMDGGFLDPLPTPGSACAGFPSVQLSPAPPRDGVLFLVVELRTNGAGRVSRVEEMFSFPDAPPQALIDSLEGRLAFDSRTRQQVALVLNPCADRLTWFDREPVCLPGYQPEDRQAQAAAD